MIKKAQQLEMYSIRNLKLPNVSSHSLRAYSGLCSARLGCNSRKQSVDRAWLASRLSEERVSRPMGQTRVEGIRYPLLSETGCPFSKSRLWIKPLLNWPLPNPDTSTWGEQGRSCHDPCQNLPIYELVIGCN